MKSLVGRKKLTIILIGVLAALFAVIAPTPAYAYESPVVTQYSYAQAGERIFVTNEDNCVPPAGVSYTGKLHMEFIDSTSTSFHQTVQGYASSGTLGVIIVTIPVGAAPGLGVIKLSCVDDSSSLETMTFSPIPFTVVTPSSVLQVTHPYMWGTMHIGGNSHVCSWNEPIMLQVKKSSSVHTSNDDLPVSTISASKNVNGSWSATVPLNPSGPYDIGEKYSVRAYCGTDVWTADSFGVTALFEVKTDSYVAMGDSYSSGEGSYNYDLAGGNCHRSTDSYAYYLVDNAGLDLPNFTACSGAVTDDLFNANPVNTSEPAQISRLSDDTEVVTLTIGGNDLDFSHILEECLESPNTNGYDCSTNTLLMAALESGKDALAGDLPPNTTAYNHDSREIHSIAEVIDVIVAEAPNVDVYIAGYPELFGDNTSYFTADGDAPGGYKCVVWTSGPVEVDMSYWDVQWINQQAVDLNQIIEDAVDESLDPKVHYVPVDTFNGHGLCDSGTPYINPVFKTSVLHPTQPESIHPNTVGMSSGYGVAFDAVIN